MCVNAPVTQVKQCKHGISVIQPDGQKMTATHTALINMPHLPVAVRKVHLFPDLQNKSLLSLGQFCDNGYEIQLTQTSIHIKNTTDPSLSLTGSRAGPNSMWMINLLPPTINTTNRTIQQMNNVYEVSKQRDIVQYLHKAAFSPVPSTWITAINAGFFATWPGLTADLVRKHLDKSPATTKGHMKQLRMNIRSTSKTSTPTMKTPSPNENVREQSVTTMRVLDVGTLYSDQTGRFPVTSSRGNKYIMVFYHPATNAILAEPIKNRSTAELIRAQDKIHKFLTSRNFKPTYQILDNECPEALQDYFKLHNVAFQLVPPHLHRNNQAERAIGTYKNHLIAGLASLDPNYPMHLWCRLIPHSLVTLNLLRPSRINPMLSAEASLNGAFDYNSTPLAPPGTKVIVYETPDVRKTWDPHGVDGWYIGSAPKHYRCHRTYISKTRKERIARTVDFFPHKQNMPGTSSAEAAIEAAIKLTAALQHPAPKSPFTNTPSQFAALKELAAIFDRAIIKAKPSMAQPMLPAPIPPSPQSTRRSTTIPAESRVGTHTPSNIKRHARVPTTTVPTMRESRVQTAPVSPETTPHIIPPDNSNSGHPLFATSEPTSGNWIEEEDVGDEIPPSSHRYPLRSHVCCNTQEHVPSSLQPQANAVVDSLTGNILEYRHLAQGPDKRLWETSLANDLGRLAQGVGTRMPKGTNTVFFIKKKNIPEGRKVSYVRLVASIRPNKTEVHRVRVTAGGDRLEYEGNASTDTASLTTVKVLLNSTISTKDARFLTLDIKDFYYGTDLLVYEYVRMGLKDIPQEIINQYQLTSLASNGWVYMEIRKGMPGLKQAGKVANVRLTEHLAKHGYAPTPRTPALWKHESLPITFTLVVDDFGVKYVGKKHAEHLIRALRELYEISIDWKGEIYIGLTLKWNYTERSVTISMPNFIAQVLHRFQHLPPSRRQNSPRAWKKPNYGTS